MLLPLNQAIETNEHWESAFLNWKMLTTETTKPEVPIQMHPWFF